MGPIVPLVAILFVVSKTASQIQMCLSVTFDDGQSPDFWGTMLFVGRRTPVSSLLSSCLSAGVHQSVHCSRHVCRQAYTSQFIALVMFVGRRTPVSSLLSSCLSAGVHQSVHCSRHVCRQAYTSQFIALVMFALVMCEDKISVQPRRREIIHALSILPGTPRPLPSPPPEQCFLLPNTAPSPPPKHRSIPSSQTPLPPLIPNSV